MWKQEKNMNTSWLMHFNEMGSEAGQHATRPRGMTECRRHCGHTSSSPLLSLDSKLSRFEHNKSLLSRQTERIAMPHPTISPPPPPLSSCSASPSSSSPVCESSQKPWRRAKCCSSSLLSISPSVLLPSRLISFSLIAIFLLLTSQLTSACGPGRGGGKRRSPRKLTPLVFKQHVPNVSENTLGASGLTEGRVTRNHKRFRELGPNYNDDIVFRDEEGTGADRLMTQRLKEKLNTLAISVMNQWPGVKLRVIEGWDEEGSHAMDSLHYEGRAVDITTSDRDRSKYGMLARLAVEAGFDWVYYESRSHIHCSVKSEKSEAAKNGGCFEESNLVYDAHTGPKPIKDVQIGDRLLSLGSNGSFEYSEVIMFLDRDPDTDRLYYRVETESGHKISLTPSHLLMVGQKGRQGTLEEVFTQNVEVGQHLFVRSSSSDGKLERIVSITTLVGHGAYAPLTLAGNLVVNNVTASCYAVVRSQSLVHFAFFPFRWANAFIKFGDRLSEALHIRDTRPMSVSMSSRQSRQSTDAAVKQVGIHWYASLLSRLFRHLIPSSLIFN